MEVAEDRAEEHRREGRRPLDAQVTFDATLGSGGCADDLVQLGDQPLILREQSLARWRERQGACRTNEQLRTHFVFEAGDALRDD